MKPIKSILLESGVKQKELAVKCGVRPVELSYIIHGRRKVSFERKIQIVEAINSLLDKRSVIAGPAGSPRTQPAARVTISDVFPDTFKKISKTRLMDAVLGRVGHTTERRSSRIYHISVKSIGGGVIDPKQIDSFASYAKKRIMTMDPTGKIMCRKVA